MRSRSIRLRLTLWYFAVQAITFAAFGIGIFLTVRESVHAAIDQDLRLRLEGIQRFMQRAAPVFSQEDLREEIREHSGLRPGGDLLQVSDASGEWVFRSASIRNYDIPQPGGDLSTPRYETKTFNGALLRIVSAKAGVPDRSYTVQLASPLGQVFDVLHRLQ